MSHGSKQLTLGYAPRSRLYQGFFGRMFRNLPPYEPPGMSDADKAEFLTELGRVMIEGKCGRNKNQLDNDSIPAGYTYFGQFVDHDLTFDPLSKIDRQNDPHMLENFRTPRFDLDNVYGSGPDDSPFMYNADGTFILGKGENGVEDDLPRIERLKSDGTLAKRAVIGDPRNDENIMVSQLQLSFLKFHNKMLEKVGDFAEAQRLVRWHYQYVVVHDFLRRIIGKDLLKQLLPKDDDPCCKDPHLCHYGYKHQPFMPVEFAVAAYRFGHSMVRPAYSLNHIVQNVRTFRVRGVPAGPLEHLGGFRQLPPSWTVQWNLFLDFPNDSTKPQPSRKIDPCLADPLDTLPENIVGDLPASLAARNLLRGWRMELPSGQAVAKAICGCDCDDLKKDFEDLLKNLPKKAKKGKKKDPKEKPIPLFTYILLEANSSGKCGGNGERLGKVGGTIVGEVFLGLLAGDPNSYFNVDPCWTPTIPIADSEWGLQLSDILKFASAPITAADVDKEIAGST